MTSFIWRVLLAVVLLVQVGCSGLKNCSSSAIASGIIPMGWSQTCSATYDELMEWQEVRISFDDLGVISGQVAAEVRLTVESGSASLTMLDSNNMPVVVTASAGQPGTYTGSATVSVGPSVRFSLTPLDGTARKVFYEVRFSG